MPGTVGDPVGRRARLLDGDGSNDRKQNYREPAGTKSEKGENIHVHEYHIFLVSS